MANSFISLYIHYVFSTKNREPLILPEMQEQIWGFMGGIARKNKMKALAIGGIKDHVHLLISLPATLSVSKGVQMIKGGSSRWINDTFDNINFSWQEGYGAFSINVSIVEDTVRYIRRQEEHHKYKSFQEEYVEFLKKHGIDYDERYIWD
jgi:REP element-mobilizing transposase RayT